MGKNKKNDGGVEEDNKKKESGGNNNITVVLKADLHCEGCASKVIKCIRSFEGVEKVTAGDAHKISVIGKVDPVELREKVEKKTHKKVELISPVPNNKEGAKGKESGVDKVKGEKKNESKDNNSDEKKSKGKEPPVNTMVFKLDLHCNGCIQKIYKIITRTKGYQDVKIDRQKELVTVTGAMDMMELAEILRKRMKKEAEIVPPKKEPEKKKMVAAGSDKAQSGGGHVEGGGDKKIEGNEVQVQIGDRGPFMHRPGSMVDQYQYSPYPVGPYHAPQIFSDENPNACSVM
ncbi:Heavy metal transport/detoxification superfamily protein [Abeliophyllum distichum]|uniref:Heavy metal transport/detoxification superfamily protein n=1 Tax=Abeliophyllum distichum TaxID=126358 RepID=A0ABD1TEU3_9LAMI